MTHVLTQLGARAGRTMRRCLRYRGMLVLVVWQMPIEPVIRPNGSIGLMIGGGSDEHVDLSCEGDLIESDSVRYKVAAIEADHDITERLRAESVVGFSRSDWDSHQGAFGTLRLRADWRYFGIGAGFAVSPAFDRYESGTSVWPSLYIRGGSAEGVHVRADAYQPTPLVAQQIARIGLGFNAVHRDEPSGFIGLAALGNSESSTGIAAEFTAPMTDRFALRVQGHYASGHAHPVAGLTLGGRFLLQGAIPAPNARTSAKEHEQ